MDASNGAPTVSTIIPELGSNPVAAVLKGLPYSALEHLQEHHDASDELLGRALGISARTLSRRRESGTLTKNESDRLVPVAEILALARWALDNQEQARDWLGSPHEVLGGESPLDHMDTVTGIQAVKTMLHHIEHGMPA